MRVSVLDHQPVPDIRRYGQAVRSTTKDQTKLLRDSVTHISMAGAGEPRENGFAKRLIRTIKE